MTGLTLKDIVAYLIEVEDRDTQRIDDAYAAIEAQGYRLVDASHHSCRLGRDRAEVDDDRRGCVVTDQMAEVTGVIVFDVPKDAKLARLELHDSPFSGGVEVQIGRPALVRLGPPAAVGGRPSCVSGTVRSARRNLTQLDTLSYVP